MGFNLDQTQSSLQRPMVVGPAREVNNNIEMLEITALESRLPVAIIYIITVVPCNDNHICMVTAAIMILATELEEIVAEGAVYQRATEVTREAIR